MNEWSWVWHEKWQTWEMRFSNGTHFFGTKDECLEQAFPSVKAG